MKKLIEVVNEVRSLTDEEYFNFGVEKIVIAMVAANPESRLQLLYCDMVTEFLRNRRFEEYSVEMNILAELIEEPIKYIDSDSLESLLIMKKFAKKKDFSFDFALPEMVGNNKELEEEAKKKLATIESTLFMTVGDKKEK